MPLLQFSMLNDSLNSLLSVSGCRQIQTEAKTEGKNMRKTAIVLQGMLMGLAVVGFFVGSMQLGAPLI